MLRDSNPDPFYHGGSPRLVAAAGCDEEMSDCAGYATVKGFSSQDYES